MSDHRVLVSWSTGKDSALLLHRLRQREDVEVVGLLTTVSEEDGRVAVHGVRRELLDAQASACGLPLFTVSLPEPCPNAIYEERMRDALAHARRDGVTAVAFGDLFQADIRQYREAALSAAGLDLWFPLWGEPTDELAREMIELGLRARLTCIDTEQCPSAWLGRVFDETLLDSFPLSIDPCGERGEFHTFAFEGPIFEHPVIHKFGVTKNGGRFAFADLLPL